MTDAQRLAIRSSEIREKLNTLQATESLTDEQRSEMDSLRIEFQDVETRRRAAIALEPEPETRTLAEGDAEHRERVELRSKASLTAFLLAAMRGRQLKGAEAELQEAAGVDGIPLELWDTAPVMEAREKEERVVAALPGSTGVNLDPIRPAVFANSIAPRLGIEMPRVMSGTFASATITTSQTAAAAAKGGDAAAIAGAMTAQTATPKRVSARLELAIEDIAAVGQSNFESILRENLSLALSAELDDQAINGNGTAPNLTGIFARLTDPADPASGVESWTRFLAIQSGGIDGLWASELSHIALVVNPETFRLAAATFQGSDAEESAASYLKRMGGGFWTNSRMPDTDANIAQGLLYRMGRSMAGGSMGMRTAVCPHWNTLGVDDIFSGSASGTRAFTMHVLLGDVILVQPDAYAQVAYRVSV